MGMGGGQILAKIPILSGLYKVEFASYKQVLYMFLVPFDSKNTSRNFSEASETCKLIFLHRSSLNDEFLGRIEYSTDFRVFKAI